MAFRLENVVPRLIRKDVEWAETNFPSKPDEIPAVVAADPGWSRQWRNVEKSIEMGAQTGPGSRKSDTVRRKAAADYLAILGHLEFDLIVKGCSYAATRYEMPTAWRMCVLKQGFDDMNHAAGFITRACRMADHDYWQGVKAPYQKTIGVYQPILERDLGGWFSAVAFHTEGYPAWTNLSGGSAITDPVVAGWSFREIEEEAWHLDFLLPAMKEYLHSGTPEEQDRMKHQLIRDNEDLLQGVLQPAYRNSEEFAVNRLGWDRAVLWGYEHVDERTRYLLRAVGVEESYWPGYLRGANSSAA